MEICNLGPDVMDEVYQMTGVKAAGLVWAANTHDGAWVRNQTAGGCRNYISTDLFPELQGPLLQIPSPTIPSSASN